MGRCASMLVLMRLCAATDILSQALCKAVSALPLLFLNGSKALDRHYWCSSVRVLVLYLQDTLVASGWQKGQYTTLYPSRNLMMSCCCNIGAPQNPQLQSPNNLKPPSLKPSNAKAKIPTSPRPYNSKPCPSIFVGVSSGQPR